MYSSSLMTSYLKSLSTPCSHKTWSFHVYSVLEKLNSTTKSCSNLFSIFTFSIYSQFVDQQQCFLLSWTFTLSLHSLESHIFATNTPCLSMKILLHIEQCWGKVSLVSSTCAQINVGRQTSTPLESSDLSGQYSLMRLGFSSLEYALTYP